MKRREWLQLFVNLRVWATLTIGLAGYPLASTAEETVRFDTSRDAAVRSRLLDDVTYLASDKLEGRGVKTKGIDLAADFIARSYRQAGLKTDHYNGSPFHVFHTSRQRYAGKKSRLKLVGPNGQQIDVGKLGDQFTPLSMSTAGEFDLPVVFAGYGITEPKAGYDDYANLDVRGKAVILLRHEPRQADPDSPFNGTKNSKHAYLVSKIANAAVRGAKMVIFCTDQHSIDHPARGKPSRDALMPFQVNAALFRPVMPVVHTLRKPLDSLLAAAKSDANLAEREKRIDEKLKPQSMALDGWRVQGAVEIASRGNGLKNVVGSLETKARTNETIVVGAHYDHLGRGESGSLAPWTKAIHNGADDNGSGTVVLLETARQLAARRGDLKRRILFIAFSAEESGLIGSRRYVRSPLISLDDTVAMVNLDMVGRLTKEKLTVYGTGTAAEFDGLIDRLGGKYGFRLDKRRSGSGPSDHASFYAARVPVLHLFTGLHRDYHRPSDDVEKLNLDGMVRVARMTTEIVYELATAEKRPTAKRSRATARAAPISDEQLRKARLGIIVNAQNGSGCGVERVVKGGAAHKAGLRQSDIITHLNGQAVKSVQDFTSRVKKTPRTEPLKLRVVREGVTLGIIVP